MLCKQAYLVIFSLLLSTSVLTAKPVFLSKVVQENQITSLNDQPLLLIDFWASWCKPCIVVNKQLEVVQQRNEDKLFIISLSHESESLITKHLSKHPTKLMVGSDDNQKTVKHFNVDIWPFAVLLSTNGDVLWKGHPADLSQSMIDNFHQKVSKKPTLPIDALLSIEKGALAHASPFDIQYGDLFEYYYEKTEDRVYFEGTTADLCRHIYRLNPLQVLIENEINTGVGISAKKDFWNKGINDIWLNVLNDQGLSIEIIDKLIPVFSARIDNRDLLVPSTSDQGNRDSKNFIIDNQILLAYGMTINELMNLLSQYSGHFFISSDIENQEYNWKIDTKSIDTIVASLEDVYGFAVSYYDDDIQFFKLSK